MASSRIVRASLGILVAGSAIAAACLVLTPLDDVNVSATDGGGAKCLVNADCNPNVNDFFRCLDGRCVSLVSKDCLLVRGRHKDPNALYLGAFGYLNPSIPGRDDSTWNYELALDELNAAPHGGLPGANGTQPIALVLCQADPPLDRGETRIQRVLETTRHLVDEVKVPALIAALDSDDLLQAFDAYGKKKGVFFFTPFGATTLPTYQPDEVPMLWHLLGRPRDLSGTYVATLASFESYVKNRRSLSRDLKLAIVHTTASFDADLFDATKSQLRWNGRDWAANEGLGLYMDLSLPLPTTQADISGAAQTIITEKPDIVISMTGPLVSSYGLDANSTQGLLQVIEREWEGADSARPHYLLSPLNADQADGEVSTLIKKILYEIVLEPEAAKRFIGINVAGSEDGGLYNDYLNRLRDHAQLAAKNNENFYDVVYFLAYGIVATGLGNRVSGSDIATKIERLIRGGTASEFSVGPEPIGGVFEALKNPDQTIRLLGTLGPPRFDRSRGVRIATGALYCFEKLPGNALAVQYQVGYFDRDAQPEVLRVSKRFAGPAKLPCLDEDFFPKVP
jgi:hypothetical protein